MRNSGCIVMEIRLTTIAISTFKHTDGNDSKVLAGGYPGLLQKWSPELIEITCSRMTLRSYEGVML